METISLELDIAIGRNELHLLASQFAVELDEDLQACVERKGEDAAVYMSLATDPDNGKPCLLITPTNNHASRLLAFEILTAAKRMFRGAEQWPLSYWKQEFEEWQRDPKM